MQPQSIEVIVSQLLRGQMRVPSFQRGFVWDSDRIAYFMDSLYKGYPVGSVLLWRTRVQLRTERQLGPFELPQGDPDYPIDYVLDGQQRITSIFSVFQTTLKQPKPEEWLPIYFDLEAKADAQETQFFALHKDEVISSRHFPLSCIFSPVNYRAETAKLSDEKLIEKVDAMQKRFLQITLPVQMFETEDRAQVAIVFERVNRLGIPLNIMQLLSAWTWSEDFDLQEQFSLLSSELEPFGFDAVEQDPDLLLRCCAAIVASDASPRALMSLSGSNVRERFEEIGNGVKGAIDFLKNNLGIPNLKAMPFATLLVPLAVFFAVPGNGSVRLTAPQKASLIRWFWRSCFSRRYSSGVLRNLKDDIAAMTTLRDGVSSSIDSIKTVIEPEFFTQNTLNTGSVNSKTFILMLAHQKPLSFVSGQPVSLEKVLKDYNRNEFHHIYPKAFLSGKVEVEQINQLANFAFISAIDNKTLGGVKPSLYKPKMSTKDLPLISKKSLLPDSTWKDDFETFIAERALLLTELAKKLID